MVDVGPLTRSLLAIIAAVTCTGCGNLAPPRDPTFASVRAWVESHHAASAAEVLASLPESFRSHYVLLFESRSPQAASFELPRAIVYGSDATFIVAFNGDPAEHGFRSLDTMEFDRDRSEFVFREIVFPEGEPNGQTRVSTDNPPRCAECHGHPARPIWDTYPIWPGAYGEHARAPLSEAESRGLTAFETLRKENTRYSMLRDRPRSNGDAIALAYRGADRVGPNSELGALLGRWEADALARDVIGSSRFADYEYALVGSLARPCATVDMLPAPAREALDPTYVDFAAAALRSQQRHEELKAFRALSPGAPSAASDPFELLQFRYIAERAMGLASEPWSLAFERAAYDSALPRFASLFVQRAAERDPALRGLFEVAQHGDCRELQRRSQRQLRPSLAAPASPPSSVASADPRTGAGRALPLPAILSTCIGCHEGDVAPPIPFDDPAKLREALKQHGYPHGSLLDEIAFRLRPEARARRMPLGVDLSSEEIARLSAHLGL
jgi:cytochrome c553